jgi:hypothetical protein
VALGTAAPLSAALLSPSGASSDVTADVTWVSSAPRTAFVTNAPDAPRQVVGRTPGTAILLGRIDGWVGQVAARVTPAKLSALDVVAPPALLGWWPAPFQAIGHFDDGSVQDLTAQVSWSSSSPTHLRIRGTGLDRGRSVVVAAAPASVDVTARPRGGPATTAHGLPVNPHAAARGGGQGGRPPRRDQGRLQALGAVRTERRSTSPPSPPGRRRIPSVASVSSLIRPGRIRGLRAESTVITARLQGVGDSPFPSVPARWPG